MIQLKKTVWTRYRAPRRAAYLGSGILVALGGASLGCYRFLLHNHDAATIAINSWLAPSLVAYPWADYIPLLSVILMYTGTNCHIIHWNISSQNFVVRIWPWLCAHCVHAPRWGSCTYTSIGETLIVRIIVL